MNLSELLIATLMLALSGGSSLGIWGQISAAVLQEEQRQLLSERLEEELASVEASLRPQSRRGLPPLPCGASAAVLRAWLSARPAASGVRRQLALLDGQDGLLLELSIEGLPLRRQRLYLPAALGLCSTASAPANAPVNSPVGPAATPGHG